jgi:protein-tyrosine phosphatase
MWPAPSEEERVFTVLAVCTGNICRSPVVERLLSAQVGSSVRVESAGTRALVGHPIASRMGTLIERQGGYAGNFSARQLTEAVLDRADLVLTLTRAHRALVVEMRPVVVQRAFTLRQFARLIESVSRSDLPEGTASERLQAAVAIAVTHRGRGVVQAEDDDVVDPYRQNDACYVRSFEQMLPAIHTIASVLATEGAPTVSN